MSVQELCSQVNALYDSRQYDAIIKLLFENKNIANHDNFLATIFMLCFIYSQEKEAGEKTIFSKVNTVDELLERYTKFKFLLTRVDFDVSDENVPELHQFMEEYRVSSHEMKVIIDHNVMHKELVWEKIKK